MLFLILNEFPCLLTAQMKSVRLYSFFLNWLLWGEKSLSSSVSPPQHSSHWGCRVLGCGRPVPCRCLAASPPLPAPISTPPAVSIKALQTLWRWLGGRGRTGALTVTATGKQRKEDLGAGPLRTARALLGSLCAAQGPQAWLPLAGSQPSCPLSRHGGCGSQLPALGRSSREEPCAGLFTSSALLPSPSLQAGVHHGHLEFHTSVGNILGTLIPGVWVSGPWGLSFVVPGIITAAMGVLTFLFLIECEWTPPPGPSRWERAAGSGG